MVLKRRQIYQPQERFAAHSQELKTIELKLGTNLQFGLTNDEAKKRLMIFGQNSIPPVKGSIWAVYLSPLFNWLINIYLIVTFFLIVLSFWVPETWSQIGFWLFIIAFNIAFTIFQQIRAQKKLDALHKLSPPQATVLRDGIPNQISAQDLAIGDIIEFDQGDRVPADARIISVSNLLVNESALTGESVAVEKTDSPSIVLPLNTSLSQRNNMVYTGTYIEYGRALAIVVNTGVFTELGALSLELEAMGTNEIPIRAKVNVLAKWLGLAVLTFIFSSVIYKLVYHSQRGTISNIERVMSDITISLTTSMAIMPIAIPLLTTIILLTGVLSMAKDRVIIRNLSAIETLGRCSILATDKTGTITQNQMAVKHIWDSNQYYTVTGTGYSNKGAIIPLGDDKTLTLTDEYVFDSLNYSIENSEIGSVLVGGLLNNNAHLIVEEVFEPNRNVTWKATGDPTDAAFLALFNKSGMNEAKIKQEFGYIKEYNFDSTLKRMSKVFENSEGFTLFCKGATETVLPLCDLIGSDGQFKELTENDKKRILEDVNYFASKGYRVISLAFRKIPRDTIIYDDRELLENNLTYNGFVCIQDPPRDGVSIAVEDCYDAGIIPIMITGDSPQTALAIAKEVGIVKRDELAVEGEKIAELEDELFFNTRVFARVSPQHKQQIIGRYKQANKIVAMTGDGVNDALALTQADCGICMGISGTEVAKQASDVVISDDSYNSTVLGIKEGRGLFEKIRYMIFFFITVNVAEAIIYFSSSYIPGFVLVNNVQRVILFATAHTIPTFVFIVDKITKDVMNYPPRNDENIFNKNYWGAFTVLALSLALSSGAIYLLCYFAIIPVFAYNQGLIIPNFDQTANIVNPASWEHAKARTMFLTVLIIAECLVVLSIRHFNKPVWKSLKENFSLLILFIVLFVPIGLVMVLYNASIQNFLVDTLNLGIEFLPLTVIDWLIVAIAISIPLLSLESYKYSVRKRKQFF